MRDWLGIACRPLDDSTLAKLWPLDEQLWAQFLMIGVLGKLSNYQVNKL